MNNSSLNIVIDYLKNPSIGEVQDYSRRRSLWKALKIDEKIFAKKIKKINSDIDNEIAKIYVNDAKKEKKYWVEKKEQKRKSDIENEKKKYHEKIKKAEEIDEACQKIENDLLSYDKTFSKKTSEQKSVPKDQKDFYKTWSNLKSNRKFLSKDLGEEIVGLYYKIQNMKYERDLKVESVRTDIPLVSKNNQKYHEPDGLENDMFYVEVKMRAYKSEGTAHEKIPSVAFKYADLPKKIKLFLLADDEHKYNTYWSQLIRGDIESSNKYNFEFENEYKRIHKAVIEKIVYGSEVAAELEKFLI